MIPALGLVSVVIVALVAVRFVAVKCVTVDDVNVKLLIVALVAVKLVTVQLSPVSVGIVPTVADKSDVSTFVKPKLVPVKLVTAPLAAPTVVTYMLPPEIDTSLAFWVEIEPNPKLVLAPDAVLAPVPPLLMASVPDIVMTPAAVTGPPVNTTPETVLLTSMLVTVPAPVSVCQVGIPAPVDARTCPGEPTVVRSKLVPLLTTTAPATGDIAEPVPPRPIGRTPVVSFASDRSTAG